MTQKQADKLLAVFGPRGKNWIKGVLHGVDGGHCIVGGLHVAFPTNRTQVAVTKDIKTALGFRISPNEQLAYWNDAPERTFSDVRKLILSCVTKPKRKAAK